MSLLDNVSTMIYIKFITMSPNYNTDVLLGDVVYFLTISYCLVTMMSWEFSLPLLLEPNALQTMA